MKRLLLSILLLFPLIANATQVTIPTVYQNGGQVTAANLNGNFTAITQVVNGGIDNTNANTTSGYRLFQEVSTLPSAGNQGSVYFLTTDNTLNFDTGSAFVKSVVITGTPSANQVPVYNGTAWVPTSVSNIGVPSGEIVAWSGSIASIPSGWVICDGSNGTPNLRDRFIVGAGNIYAVGATGGATTKTLAANQIPSLTVTVVANNSSSSFGSSALASSNTAANTSYSAGSYTNGSQQSVSILPPYYALAYIMKT